MSEWLKEHAWKSDLFTRADAHQIPPTHFRSTTSRNKDVHAHVPVNHGVHPGFRRVCDTVLTQFRSSVAPTRTKTYRRVRRVDFDRDATTRAQHKSAERFAPTLYHC